MNWYTFCSLPSQSLRFFLGGGGANFNFVGLNWSASPNFGQRFGCNLGWRIWSESNFQKDPHGQVWTDGKGEGFVRWNSWIDWSPLDGWLTSQPGWAPKCPGLRLGFSASTDWHPWDHPWHTWQCLGLGLSWSNKNQWFVVLYRNVFFLFDTSMVDGSCPCIFWGSWTTGTSEKMIFREGAGSKGFDIADDAKNPELFWLLPSAGSLAPAWGTL